MTNEKLRYWITDTVRGPAALIGGSGGLRAVILPGLSREELLSEVRERFPSAVLEERGLTAAARSLARYFSDGRLTGRAPRLDLSAIGPFRRSVYEALLTIPSGEVVTYAELARRIGKPGAHRSVGTALSRNPIPLFIPCHRVVRSDGGLGGFTTAGGIELKRFMLVLESRIFDPEPRLWYGFAPCAGS